jgi:hypothetical protein
VFVTFESKLKVVAEGRNVFLLLELTLLTLDGCGIERRLSESRE